MRGLAALIIIALLIALFALCWVSFELGYQRGWNERGWHLSRRSVDNLKPFVIRTWPDDAA